MINYEINESTLALVPISGGTHVYEYDNNFIINKDVNKIINYSCEFFGSSYEGRKQGSKNMLGLTHKLPIIIEESKNIIFFPMSSPRLNKTTWVSLKNIKSYKNLDSKSVIIFKNNDIISVDISYSSLNNQVLRASRLESILNNRKN